MTQAIENTNLLNNILLAIKADSKGVSQVSIKVIRNNQVAAAGDCYVIKPNCDTIEPK